MSIVCAKVTEKGVEVAADTAMSTGDHRTTVFGLKCFMLDGYVFGFVGMAEAPSFFRAFWSTYGNLREDRNEFTHVNVVRMALDFFRFVLQYFPEHDPNFGSMLITNGVQAFAIEGLAVVEVDDFYAIGSGAPIADAFLRKGASAYEAVCAACETNVWCHTPIEVYDLFGDTLEYWSDDQRDTKYETGGR